MVAKSGQDVLAPAFCSQGELNNVGSGPLLKTSDVFGQHGEAEQLKLFSSYVEPLADYPGGARVGEWGAAGENAPVRRLAFWNAIRVDWNWVASSTGRGCPAMSRGLCSGAPSTRLCAPDS
jgi:hypothetical protein